MLFHISYMAFQLAGYASQEIEVQHGTAIAACDTAEEAHRHYMDEALERFPPGEGWQGHSVVMAEFGLKCAVEDGALRVTLQLRGKAEIDTAETIEIEVSDFSM